MQDHDRDHILLQEFLFSGESAAFAPIVEKYHGSVYGLAYKFTHNSADAQDLTQETFLRAYESLLKKADREILLKSWLMTICVNLCRNLAKKKKSFNFSDLEREDDDYTFMEGLPGTDSSPSEKASAEETQLAVRQAPQKLPEKYQIVVELRYVQDLSYEEIAHVLKIPINTVKVHLNRAKRTLKSYLPPLPNG